MRKARIAYIITGWILVGAGCTKGSPTFTVLDQSVIPRPTFGGAFARALTRANTVETTLIEGECDARIRAIDVRVTSPGTIKGRLDAISVGTPTIACAASGKFSFTLRSLVDLVATPQAFQTYRIELRADTAGGVSDPSVLAVTFVRDGDERWRLTAGGTESTTTPKLVPSQPGGSFRADVRLTHLTPSGDPVTNPALTTSTQTQFRLKRGHAAH